MLAPVLEEIEGVNVIKVDVDIHMDLAREYGVMSVPTLLYVKDGVVKNKTIGYIFIYPIEEYFMVSDGFFCENKAVSLLSRTSWE